MVAGESNATTSVHIDVPIYAGLALALHQLGKGPLIKRSLVRKTAPWAQGRYGPC